MDKRVLWGCLAALGTMFGFDLLAQLSGWKLDGPVRTSFGMIYIGGAVTTFAAMTLGGWIARRNFQWIALVLGVILWVATIAVLYSVAPLTDASSKSLSGILKFNGLAIALSLTACWFGATVGERLAARQRPAS